MKNKKCIIAVLATIVFVQIYEFIIHGSALSGLYEMTASVWRPHQDIGSYMPWMIIGQVLFAVMFCVAYCCSKCTGSVKQGALFGLYVGLLMSSVSFIYYAVLPIPLSLLAAWIVSGVVETILMGIILAVLMKQK